MSICCVIFFFFFQAEDGIRDLTVTGVQTCALPISEAEGGGRVVLRGEVVESNETGWQRLIITDNGPGDRKSTRLNSSHSQISYAVFCLKKKKILSLITYLPLLVDVIITRFLRCASQ